MERIPLDAMTEEFSERVSSEGRRQRPSGRASGRRGSETAPNGTAEPSRGPRADGDRSEARSEVEAVDSVHLAQLAAGDEASLQHFRIEPGATVPEHDHRHEQLGFVYAGELTFLVEGDDGEREELVVGPGDSYVIPGGEPHGAENRGDEEVRGIDVFSPARPDPDWAE